MSKLCIGVIFAVLVITSVPSYAGKPEPQPTQVEVINVPENPVPVTTTDQLDVNITNSSPIPVTTIDGADKKTIVSNYYEFTIPGQETFMTVPEGKTLILTDIIVMGGPHNSVSVDLLEDSEDNIRFSTQVDFSFERDPNPFSFNLNSGIPFNSGVSVIIRVSFTDGTGKEFISGYLTDL